MLTTLKRLTGMPVICQDRVLGYVDHADVKVPERRLTGVLIRKGIGGARWCAAEEMLLIGRSCIVVRQNPIRPPQEKLNPCRYAYWTTGEHAGEVTDAIIRCETLKMEALEISPGPWYRLMGRRAYAREFWQNSAFSGIVTPQLLTWTQLLGQIGEEDGP